MIEHDLDTFNTTQVVHYLEANGLFVARLPELQAATRFRRIDLLALRLRSPRIGTSFRADPGIGCDPDRNELLLVSIGGKAEPQTTNVVCLVQPRLTEAVSRLANVSAHKSRSVVARVLRHGRSQTTTGVVVRHVVFAKSFRDLTENAHWVPLDFVHTFLSTFASAGAQE